MKRWLTELMLLCAAVSGVWAAEEKQPIKPFRPVEIVIHAAATRPIITDFDYDVKQPGKAKSFSTEDAKNKRENEQP